MTEVLCRVEDVCKSFGDTQALIDVNAEIKGGSLTGLVGPDGAGKTTLMRLMAALLQADRGSIHMAGYDTRTDDAGVHSVTGYMPQRFGLYEDLTVMENLTLYARLRSLPSIRRDETFSRLLDFTRLGQFTRRRAGNLSGGMKQKLGLACALMAGPKILLLDEPSVGVDPVSRRELWQMVTNLTQEGMAVVWSTAYLDEAERCDSVILINEGTIEFDGPPDSLANEVRGRTWRLRAADGDLRAMLGDALELPQARDGVIQGASLRIVLADADAQQSLREFAASNGASIEPTDPRFEDAFIDRLGGGPGGRSELAETMEPATLDSAYAVTCRGLTKRFGDFTAAGDVTFDVSQGEIFGLLGPNGAGKSTTFKMLCGLLKPTEGEARVAGHDLLTTASAAKQQLGYMAQKFSLYGLLSVRQNLRFYSGIYGLSGRQRRERMDEMIGILGLGELLDRSADQLPLGFRQRLALACALMHRPPILFLDEPTSGVDPITRREFWTHINGLVRKGVTILVTTHFMDEAEYCDRVAMMYRSRVIALDTPDALKSRSAGAECPKPTMEDAFIAMVEAEQRATVEQAA